MRKLPKDIRKILHKYISNLECRLEFKREALEQVSPRFPPEYRITDEQASVYLQIREPIVRTIIAYGNALSGIYDAFPELKKKAKKNKII